MKQLGGVGRGGGWSTVSYSERREPSKSFGLDSGSRLLPGAAGVMI